MATKGSTSGQSIEKIREREEARRQLRKARRSAPPHRQARIIGNRTLVLEVLDRSEATLQLAYRRLDSLAPYLPKYQYHKHKQRAVMEGRLVLPDLPGEVFVDILSTCTKGGQAWRQGSLTSEVQNG